MNMHQTDITARLRRFLDRRTMPKALEGKPQAIADEMQALVAVINRQAPKGEAFGEWWASFEAKLGEINTTRSWPTEGEMRDAAKATTGPTEKRPAQGDEINSLRIAAGRIERGDPVGEGYLFGALAAELIRNGLASEASLRQYRSALYFEEKETVGEETARRRENDRIAKHDVAMSTAGAAVKRMAIPDKRMPIGDYRNEPF